MSPVLSQKEATRPTVCDFCGMGLPKAPLTGASGYAEVHEPEGIACYHCCAWLDVFEMQRTKPGDRPAIGFYLQPATVNPVWDARLGIVSNWPGTLMFKVTSSGKTQRVTFGFGNTCRRVYFTAPDGSCWSGTSYSNDDLLRNVRRLKQ